MKKRSIVGAAVTIIFSALLTSVYVLQTQFERTLVDGVLACEKPLVEPLRPFDFVDRYSKISNDTVLNLASSSDVDHLVLASVLSGSRDDSDSTFNALLGHSVDNPENQLAAVYLLRACVTLPDDSSCSDEIIDRATALDGDNGALWSLVSALHYAQGDDFGAVLALQTATEVPLYDDYFQRHLALLRDNLPKLDDYYAASVNGIIISYAVSLIVNSYSQMQPVLEMCSTRVLENPVLAQACLDYGQRLIKEGSSLITAGMGYAIQQTTYQGLGNDREFRRSEEEYIRNQQQRSKSMGAAFSLMQYDEQLSQSWMDEVIKFGEQDAIDFISTEAKRLSADENYNPCPNVRIENSLFILKDFSRWAFSRVIGKIEA